MITLWLLIFIGSHSYPTVSGIASEQECERLFTALKSERWAATQLSVDHRCISYQGVRS